jgi:hypothetical protein
MECAAWSVQHGVYSMECAAWSVQYGVCSMECTVWSEHSVRSDGRHCLYLHCFFLLCEVLEHAKDEQSCDSFDGSGSEYEAGHRSHELILVNVIQV